MSSPSRLQAFVAAVFAAVLFVAPAQAQPVEFNRLSIRTGLPSDQIFSLFEDDAGFIWIGTSEGPMRYDGLRLTAPIDIQDDVYAFLEDAQGSLWIGTATRGLYRYNRDGSLDRWQHDPTSASSLSHEFVNDLYEDDQGTIWVATDAGLDTIDPQSGEITHMPLGATPRPTLITRILPASETEFWIGTDSGLFRVNRETLVAKEYLADASQPGSLVHNDIRALHLDPAGRLWVGTLGGLDLLQDDGSFRHFESVQGDDRSLGSNRIFAITDAQDAKLWVGAIGGDVADGLNLLDPATGLVERIRANPEHPRGLPGNRVASMIVDRSGILWVGTVYHGVGWHDPLGHSMTVLTDGLAGKEVLTVAAARDGSVVVGSWDGGASRVYADGSTAIVRFENAQQPPDVTSVSIDPSGETWLATLSRLYRLPAGSTFARLAGNDNAMSYICAARDGRIWAGGWSGGLGVKDFSTGAFQQWQHDPADPSSFPAGQVAGIECNGEEIVLVSGGRVLFLSPDGDLRDAGLSNIRSAHRDDTGTLWVGVGGIGLFQIAQLAAGSEVPTPQPFAFNSELPHQTVIGIGETEDHLWFATARGVLRYGKLDQSTRSYLPDFWPFANKFGSMPMTTMADGRLVMGSSEGLIIIDPERFSANPEPPRPVVDAISYLPKETGAQPVALGPGSRLHHAQNDLSFTFMAPGFREPELTEYQYRLVGYETDWRAGTDAAEARYTNLAPGDYTFEVAATNADGIASTSVGVVRFQIAKPWWATLPAILMWIGLGGAGVFGIAEGRSKIVRRRARMLEQEVEGRTRALREKHTKLAEAHATIEAQAGKLRELDAAKSRFFTNITHEFRTPLTLISGPLRDLLTDSRQALNQAARAQLSMVLTASGQLMGLINQLLDLSRIEVGALQLRVSPVEVVGHTRRIITSFSSLAERRRIRLKFDSGSLSSRLVHLDRSRYEQMLNNLLSNAFRFTPAEGRIDVELKMTSDTLSLSVQDSGSGIAAEDLPLVFERFYQSRRDAVTGSGVGLSFVKEITDAHGGSVSVSSEPGHGTRFVIELPARAAEAEAPVQKEEPPEPLALLLTPEIQEEPIKGGPAVLVVDDHEDMRAYIAGALGVRYRVLTASGAAEALDILGKEDIALVVSDVMMPDIDGYQLTRTIKEDPSLAHLPVILLTAKAETDGKLEGLQTGADDYVFKPFDAAELRVRVENLIELRRLLKHRFGTKTLAVKAQELDLDSEDQQFLNAVQQVVEEHAHDPNFGAEWLASDVALSPRQLRRKLQQVAGVTTLGYIRAVRLDRARQMLEQQAGSVADVARAVGFNDVKYFSRLFRQVTGVLPSEVAVLEA